LCGYLWFNFGLVKMVLFLAGVVPRRLKGVVKSTIYLCGISLSIGLISLTSAQSPTPTPTPPPPINGSPSATIIFPDGSWVSEPSASWILPQVTTYTAQTLTIELRFPLTFANTTLDIAPLDGGILYGPYTRTIGNDGTVSFQYQTGAENGSYRIDLMVQGALGLMQFEALAPPSLLAQLGNISTRALVQTGDDVIIGGFIVQGPGQTTLVVRAIGPSLAQSGITNPLRDPTLELHDHTGALIAFNDNWIDAPNKQAIISIGLGPTNNLESAILTSLNPGNYTAIVRGVNNGTGVALVEGYDLNMNTGSRLGNVSTRGFVHTGDNVMIGGFIVVTQSAKVIIRAIGPSLTAHGVPDALANPQLELHNMFGILIGQNDDWQTTQIGGIITSDQVAEIRASGLAPTNPAEAAIIATLQPGNYTAIVRGVSDTTGNALVEVYDLNH
jgi:uncharacterized Zn-binding protein involved in type VI secretion